MPTNLPMRRDMRDHGSYLGLIPIVAALLFCLLGGGPLSFADEFKVQEAASGPVLSAAADLR